jgi:hypothetical protein
MQKPLAIIISGNRQARASLEDSVKRHPLDFYVKTFANMDLWDVWREETGNGHSPQVVFLDYHSAHKKWVIGKSYPTVFEAADEVSKWYHLTARVIMSKSPYKVRDLADAKDMRWMPLSADCIKVNDTLNNLMTHGRLVRPQRRGMIGFGALAGEVWARTPEDEHILENLIYSTGAARRATITALFPDEAERAKREYGHKTWDLEVLNEWVEQLIPNTTFYDSPQEVIDANPDALMISTGKHYEPGNLPKREAMFPDNFPKVDPVLEFLRGKDMLVFIESNPPGPFLKHAHDKYGLSPSKTSSISADLLREKAWAMKLLREDPDKYLRPGRRDDFLKLTEGLEVPKVLDSQVYLEIVGAHGQEWPILDTFTIRGEYMYTDFIGPDTTFLHDLVEKARPAGKVASIMAGILGMPYIGTPLVIRQGFERIARFQQPNSCWYCYMGDQGDLKGSFTQWPTKIDYSGGDVKIMASGGVNPGDSIFSGLRGQAREEAEMLRGAYTET